MKTVEEMAQAMVALYGINATRAAIEEHTALLAARQDITRALNHLVDTHPEGVAEEVIKGWVNSAPPR